jgi:hypothetical protein
MKKKFQLTDVVRTQFFFIIHLKFYEVGRLINAFIFTLYTKFVL